MAPQKITTLMYIYLALTLLCFTACNASPVASANTSLRDSAVHSPHQADRLPTVFGQSITGDFDGDGTQELLEVVVTSWGVQEHCLRPMLIY